MVEKDIVCWSDMIQGYASNGLPKVALDLFFEMQMENLRLDCYAMVGVLFACASIAFIDFYVKCGSITSAVDIFRMMKGKDRVVFNAIISGLAMDGHIWATFGVFGQMEKYGIQPDGNTFVGLLCGCTHAGLVNDGQRYFDSMSHVFSLSPTIEHYGCMVDLLSRVGLLVEAHNLNKRDTSHPMSPKIYENIESLFKELREVSYSPTTEFVFFDIEEKDKEYFLGCHSEKLAVAFFLINTGANNIICVVKNLCVYVSLKINVGANWVLGFVGKTFYADITPFEIATKSGLSYPHSMASVALCTRWISRRLFPCASVTEQVGPYA
ncbi:hypothetical protein AHAS_Ahas17G0265000 [Arachis hypogaea]